MGWLGLGLIFPRFELPPNFIFECYRPQSYRPCTYLLGQDGAGWGEVGRGGVR